MYTVWHVDKFKITFKLVINWTNEILQHIVVSSGLSRPGIIDARARYRTAARRLRNIDIEGAKYGLVGCAFVIILNLNGTYSWNVKYFAFTLGLFLCQNLFKRHSILRMVKFLSNLTCRDLSFSERDY